MELTSLDIKEPGLRILPPGVERYVVIGGGLSVFEIFPEDQIEIINNEGKQLLEIAVFNNKGKTDSSILNLLLFYKCFSKYKITRVKKIYI